MYTWTSLGLNWPLVLSMFDVINIAISKLDFYKYNEETDLETNGQKKVSSTDRKSVV